MGERIIDLNLRYGRQRIPINEWNGRTSMAGPIKLITAMKLKKPPAIAANFRLSWGSIDLEFSLVASSK
jgi:hypothetical protein